MRGCLLCFKSRYFICKIRFILSKKKKNWMVKGKGGGGGGGGFGSLYCVLNWF